MKSPSKEEIFKVLKVFGISLIASLLANGLILTSQWTISPRASQPGVQSSGSCFYETDDWKCTEKKLVTHLLDPGAVAWVEIPANYFFHDHFLGTKWNPYIGSGYPEFLNGHNKAITPSRIFLSFFPGDDGRDVVVFLMPFYKSDIAVCNFNSCDISIIKTAATCIKIRWLYQMLFLARNMISRVIKISARCKYRHMRMTCYKQ